MEYYFAQSVQVETPTALYLKLPRNARLNICIGLFSNQYFLNVLNKLPSGPIIRWEKSSDEILATMALREDPENAIAFTRFGDNNRVVSSSHQSSIDIALIVRWREPGTGNVWLCLGGFRDVGTHAAGRYLADNFVQRILQSEIESRADELYWEIVEVQGVDDNPLVEHPLVTSLTVNEYRSTVQGTSQSRSSVPLQSGMELRPNGVMNSAPEVSHGPHPASEPHPSEKAQDPPPEPAA